MKLRDMAVKSFDLVSDMNIAFFNPMGVSTPSQHTPDISKLKSQISNIYDEIKEVNNSLVDIVAYRYQDKDIENLRDGLCDIMVFALGAIHFNVDSKEQAYEVISRVFTTSEREVQKPIYVLMYKISQYVERALNSKEYESAIETQHIINQLMAGICFMTMLFQEDLGINPLQDMETVVNGVMTRFCKDQESLQASIEFWKNEGVTEVYTEGEFPRVALKSAKDQPDAPKGKFLKSVNTVSPIFSDIAGLVEKLPTYLYP